MRTNKHPPPSLQLSPFHHSMLQCFLDLDWEAVWTKTILILIRTKRPSGQKENKNSPPSLSLNSHIPHPRWPPPLTYTHTYTTPLLSFIPYFLRLRVHLRNKKNRKINKNKTTQQNAQNKDRQHLHTHTYIYTISINIGGWILMQWRLREGWEFFTTPIFFFFPPCHPHTLSSLSQSPPTHQRNINASTLHW
jgi:hypothetical protein